MNEIIKSKLTNVDFVKGLADKGKYGVIALGIVAVYKIIDKAIERDYNISVDAKNLRLEFSK